MSVRRFTTYGSFVLLLILLLVSLYAIAQRQELRKRAASATTLAITAHEIPHEIADFGILLHDGIGKKKALFFNPPSRNSPIVRSWDVERFPLPPCRRGRSAGFQLRRSAL